VRPLPGARAKGARCAAGYDGEVAAVDEAIGTFLEGIRARGVMDATTIVFTADHGEGLGEDDYWFSHGERLSDPLVRVPLLIRVVGRPAALRAEVVSLLDVLPTLATLAGSAAPEGVRGRDLFSPNVGARLAPVYMSTLRVSQITRAGVVSRGFKYLVESHPQGITEHLFRIGDESRDVSSETPESLKSLRSELVLARDSLRKVGTTERALSAEDQEKFKALGYLATR
jgi:arylsulfatase A-like enzyme